MFAGLALVATLLGVSLGFSATSGIAPADLSMPASPLRERAALTSERAPRLPAYSALARWGDPPSEAELSNALEANAFRFFSEPPAPSAVPAERKR